MSFPHYPAYKPSGVEWLGEVPEHWELSRLGFESWVRARLGWKGLKAEEYVDSGFAFLSTPNIKGRLIDFSNVNYIDIDRYDESPEIKLSSGDVLLAKDGSTLGIANVVRTLPVSATVNSSIAVITPCAKLDSIYLYYLLCGSGMQQLIQQKKGGMGVPHLFQSDLVKFAIPIPASNEQCAIATFLDRETAKIDALIAEQQRLIELLQEKRQAVISHAVTKGLNPDVPMKDSGVEWLGEVPEHWDVAPLKHHWLVTDCKHVTAEFTQEGYPLASIKEVQGRWVDLDQAKRTTEAFFKLLTEGKRTPEPGDLVFSRNATVGEVAEVPVNIESFGLGQDVVILKKLRITQSSSYTWSLLRSAPIINQLECAMIGSTFRRINVEQIKSLFIPVPPSQEQVSIGAHLDATSDQWAKQEQDAQQCISLLQERRSALISAAVTGQIDVRGLVPEAEAA
jgi:type I restriction enzyme S subunit